MGFFWGEHREKNQSASVVSFGPYRVDVGNVQLWRGAQEVKLTGKAFAVLRYFVEHPGQLATKDDLFAAAWPETVVSEATLVSCILEVRQALRDDAKKPRYIETVHRQGYRFIGKVVSDQLPVVSQTEKVRSQQSGASSQEEENQKATGTGRLESRVQSLELKGQSLESSVQRLEGVMHFHSV